MKKNLLVTLLVLGITAAAVGAFYFQRATALFTVNQTTESQVSGSKEKPKPMAPQRAHEWRALAWRDENGEIPPNGLIDALTERDDYLAQQAGSDGFGDGGGARLNWISRGPQNVGGRTRSLIIHPGNPEIIWGGSVSGGVWKSTDRGQTWTALNHTLQNYIVSSMAIDPTDPDVLYAGTGEGFFNLDGFSGRGIFRTKDGGMTWDQIPATDPGLSNNHTWSYVDRISIAYDGPNLWMLASTRSGIMRSTDGGLTWSHRDGSNSHFVAFDPTNRLNAIAEILDCDPAPCQRRVVYSEDGGATWLNSGRGTGDFTLSDTGYRVELAYSTSNPEIVYALNPTSGPPYGVVSYSENGGKNFTVRPTQSSTWIEANRYNNTLWVSPADSNFIIVGGKLLFKSTDGGATFTMIANGDILEPEPHVDQHCIVPDPEFDGENNRTVYVCNDGGVFRTDDITTANPVDGWEALNQTYQTTQFYGAAGNIDNRGAIMILGGTQDNGTLRLLPEDRFPTDAHPTWGGDGGFNAIDPTDTNYCYGEFIDLQLFRSTNRGQTIQYIHGKGEPGGISDVSGNANFIAPFVLDPNNANSMLAGGRSLWRTLDVKASPRPSWTPITPQPVPPGTEVISAIAVAPLDSNIIWIARNGHTVEKTNNGTAPVPTWTPVDDNVTSNPFPRYITRIMIDEDDSNTVYVAMGGFDDGNLQRTTNGGQTWQDITGTGLQNVPIRGIARLPNYPDNLYIGTEIGVYSSENGGGSWSPHMQGPANVPVDELTFMTDSKTMSNSTTLLAATHGRGIWTAEVPNPEGTSDAVYDFDGDGRSDISVFRPSNTNLYMKRSSQGFTNRQFGMSTDKMAVADYDGDRKADIAVFRPSERKWFRLNSSNGSVSVIELGQSGDVPMHADFDGDNRADEAVFRPSTGIWQIRKSTGGTVTVPWGLLTDIPVAADFDGDGNADLGALRRVNGIWRVLTSAGTLSFNGVLGADIIPVVADYDGDEKADLAVYRPANGVWYLRKSTGGIVSIQWGKTGDVPVPADYDGDGQTDIAVWRPSEGRWYLRQTTNGGFAVHFGAAGDIPIPKK